MFSYLWKTHNPWKTTFAEGIGGSPSLSVTLPRVSQRCVFPAQIVAWWEDLTMESCNKNRMLEGESWNCPWWVDKWMHDPYERKWYGCDMVFFLCKCWRIFTWNILMHKFRIRHYFTTSVSGINCHRLSPGFPPVWCHGAIRICFKHDFLLHCFVLGCPSLLVCSFSGKNKLT